MDDYYPCPTCGNDLRIIRPCQNWYCDYCMYYPYTVVNPYIQRVPSRYTVPHHYPYYDEPTKPDTRAIVIVLFFIILILAWISLSIHPNIAKTPTASLFLIEDQDIPGHYIGGITNISRIVSWNDVSVIIMDSDVGNATAALSDPNTKIEVKGGMMFYYNQSDSADTEFDSSDNIEIWNGKKGDQINLLYEPTGGIIADYTIS